MRSAKRRKLRPASPASPASCDFGVSVRFEDHWYVELSWVVSRFWNIFETPKPLLKPLHHFPAFFYRFSSFSYETFYDSFCRQSDSSSIPGPVILHLAWCMATWHQVVKIGCFRDDKQLSHETIQMCVESGKSNAKNHPHWLPSLPEMHRHIPSTIGDLWHWVYAISIHFHQNLMWWDM